MPWQLLLHDSDSGIVLRALIAELDALSDALEEASLPLHHSAVYTLSPNPAFVGVLSQSLKHQSARPSHSSTQSQSRGSHAAFMPNDAMMPRPSVSSQVDTRIPAYTGSAEVILKRDVTLAGAESVGEESISSSGDTLSAAWESERGLGEKGWLLPVGVGESGGGEGEGEEGHTQGEGGEREWEDRTEGASDHGVSTIVPIHLSHAPRQINVGAAPSPLTRTEVNHSKKDRSSSQIAS